MGGDVISGPYIRYADAEIIDLAPSNSTGGVNCSQPAPYPYEIEEAVGFNMNGAPMVCGG